MRTILDKDARRHFQTVPAALRRSFVSALWRVEPGTSLPICLSRRSLARILMQKTPFEHSGRRLISRRGACIFIILSWIVETGRLLVRRGPLHAVIDVIPCVCWEEWLTWCLWAPFLIFSKTSRSTRLDQWNRWSRLSLSWGNFRFEPAKWQADLQSSSVHWSSSCTVVIWKEH